MTNLPQATVGERSWWRRLRELVFGPPHVFVSCSRCGHLLGRVEPNGVAQPWRRGERQRTECFGTYDLARPGDPASLHCVKLAHIRWYA